MQSSNNEGHWIVKKTMKVIRANDGKKVKLKYRLNNKLIVFT